jgi:hypothetical protein
MPLGIANRDEHREIKGFMAERLKTGDTQTQRNKNKDGGLSEIQG